MNAIHIALPIDEESGCTQGLVFRPKAEFCRREPRVRSARARDAGAARDLSCVSQQPPGLAPLPASSRSQETCYGHVYTRALGRYFGHPPALTRVCCLCLPSCYTRKDDLGLLGEEWVYGVNPSLILDKGGSELGEGNRGISDL
ncbi:hypothetical protein LEMLEM_LOCUS8841 [Lemmus lemmus]